MQGKSEDSNWKLFSKRKIYDRDDPTQLYLERLTVFQTPWIGLKYHVIHLSDTAPDRHNHPWQALGVILRGSYTEDTPDGLVDRQPGSWRRIRRTDLHRVLITNGPVHTLMLTGRPRTDDWGFEVEGKMIPFEDYLAGG